MNHEKKPEKAIKFECKIMNDDELQKKLLKKFDIKDNIKEVIKNTI